MESLFIGLLILVYTVVEVKPFVSIEALLAFTNCGNILCKVENNTTVNNIVKDQDEENSKEEEKEYYSKYDLRMPVRFEDLTSEQQTEYLRVLIQTGGSVRLINVYT